jgi:effector-binding domain-containing protein
LPDTLPEVEVIDVDARPVAAIRGHVTFDQLATEIRRALDEVWAFLRASDLVPAHNVVVYHGAVHVPEGVDIDVGVQVDRPFDERSATGVRCVELPAGRIARAVHVGPYDRLGDTHTAVLDHLRSIGVSPRGRSWEIYGDWVEDPAQLETEVVYPLVDTDVAP